MMKIGILAVLLMSPAATSRGAEVHSQQARIEEAFVVMRRVPAWVEAETLIRSGRLRVEVLGAETDAVTAGEFFPDADGKRGAVRISSDILMKGDLLYVASILAHEAIHGRQFFDGLGMRAIEREYEAWAIQAMGWRESGAVDKNWGGQEAQEQLTKRAGLLKSSLSAFEADVKFQYFNYFGPEAVRPAGSRAKEARAMGESYAMAAKGLREYLASGNASADDHLKYSAQIAENEADLSRHVATAVEFERVAIYYETWKEKLGKWRSVQR